MIKLYKNITKRNRLTPEKVTQKMGLRLRQRCKNGKVIIFHPNENRFVFLQRYLIERKIGRSLTDKEAVTFKNGNVKDLRISNLKLEDRGDASGWKESVIKPTLSNRFVLSFL